MTVNGYRQTVIPESPDFSKMDWASPLSEWSVIDSRVEQVQHGISRHMVVFINLDGVLYVIKELPPDLAKKEFKILTLMKEQQIPCVIPIGYAEMTQDLYQKGFLFTRYLETSIPYRSLFISHAIDLYQNHLLDAISGLLVQLHINGFYWGDCSLSNILFRRDAGTLQAYLVDAETAESHPSPLSPMLRYHDLEIMQENIRGELTDLQMFNDFTQNQPLQETGSYIQLRYSNLWEEINREVIFSQNEQYRIQERIRSLNNLGFSVKDIELKPEEHGNSLKLRIFVSDRNFHRNQLMQLTGLSAEDKQAQQMMNEIYELKANMSHSGNPNISLDSVAFQWLENIFKPVAEKLVQLTDANSSQSRNLDIFELYCQLLEHKWYMSERAHYDVGHMVAVEDFVNRFK